MGMLSFIDMILCIFSIEHGKGFSQAAEWKSSFSFGYLYKNLYVDI